MTIADDLRSRAYAAQLRARALAASDDDHTLRSAAVERYTARLLTLWTMLRAGDITASEYRKQVQMAFQHAVGVVPDSARAKVQALEDQAIAKAMDLTSKDDDPESEQPSDAQRHSFGTMAAGLVWAAASMASVYRTSETAAEPAVAIYEWQAMDDPGTCPDCEALDGQQFTLDEIPFWPAEGDFDENTQCGPNCRCSLTNVENERTNAPVMKGQ